MTTQAASGANIQSHYDQRLAFKMEAEMIGPGEPSSRGKNIRLKMGKLSGFCEDSVRAHTQHLA